MLCHTRLQLQSVNTKIGKLHVRGRLVHAKLLEESMFQRLIPQDSHLARPAVLNSYQLTLHGGTSETIAHFRTPFKIPSCRESIRKMKGTVSIAPSFPLDGRSPKGKSRPPLKAFEDVGLDFSLPCNRRKAPNSPKNPTLFFLLCFASKAVHIDIVSELSMVACFAAIRRFVPRRGCLKSGKNFIDRNSRHAEDAKS